MLWWHLRRLRSKDHQVQINAARALGEAKDQRAVEPLITAVRSHNLGLQQEAVIALGKLGDARAIPALVAALHDGNLEHGLPQAAAEALARIGIPSIPALLAALEGRRTRHFARAALEGIGEPASDALASVIGHPDRYVRLTAGMLLVKSRRKQAIALLRPLLDDSSWEVRTSMFSALKGRGWQPENKAQWAFSMVARSLATGQGDEVVRMGASAVEALVFALTTSDSLTRARAAGALREIGDPRAIDPLIAMLAPYCDEEGCLADDPDLVEKVGEALRILGDERALKALAGRARDAWHGKTMVSAIEQVLARCAGSARSADLRLVLTLEGIRQNYTVDGDYAVPQGGSYGVDCSGMKRLAAEELARRGETV